MNVMNIFYCAKEIDDLKVLATLGHREATYEKCLQVVKNYGSFTMKQVKFQSSLVDYDLMKMFTLRDGPPLVLSIKGHTTHNQIMALLCFRIKSLIVWMIQVFLLLGAIWTIVWEWVKHFQEFLQVMHLHQTIKF